MNEIYVFKKQNCVLDAYTFKNVKVLNQILKTLLMSINLLERL